MEIIIENVRCFAGTHRIPITPLTLLVGENSTGKSTFLSIVSTVLNSNEFPSKNSFNKAPYELGSYCNIATSKGSLKNCTQVFKVGFSNPITDKPENAIVMTAEYTNHNGQAIMTELSFNTDIADMKLNFDNKNEINGYIKFKNVKDELAIKCQLPSDTYLGESLLVMLFLSSNKPPKKEYIENMIELNNQFKRVSHKIYSIAPIRTKPKRIYDQYRDDYNPEGDHVPLDLARNLDRKNKELKNALVEYGKESGLFKDVKIHKIVKASGEAFEIVFNIGGQNVSIADVGYGVSQALPVITQSFTGDDDSVFLLQQPEVHLHPKAQAALGTYFSNIISNSKKRFLIETHSDYLIDRVRQEVAKNKIDSKDVTILFFEKLKDKTNVHQLRLDNKGNIIEAPATYRSFFLDEEMNLLSRI